MTRLIVLLTAITAVAALRLVPHPPNFSPIDAMALFSGAYVGRRSLSFAAPLAALFLSDLVLGFYHGMTTVYATVALIVVIGWWVSSRRTPLRIGAAAVASSVVFFVITNFGMWLFSGFYPGDLPGASRLLHRSDPVLPKHACRGPILHGPSVRRVPYRGAPGPDAEGRPAPARLSCNFLPLPVEAPIILSLLVGTSQSQGNQSDEVRYPPRLPHDQGRR